ncbi:MAG: nuclear transport factor 2 family protein [Planctomycetes bacterium]|nr:nuclear transport factor 2 family protein [Planctomycetota bacterium]
MLKVTKGGFETFTDSFAISSGGKKTVRVRLEPKKPTMALVPEKDLWTLAALAQRKRELWARKAVFGPEDDTYWEEYRVFGKDQYVPYAEPTFLATAKGLVPEFLRSIEKVILAPDPPFCKAIGPLGLIRWDDNIQFRMQGDRNESPGGFGIAVSRKGQWKELVRIMGDWRLGASDRFDPDNIDHVALKKLLDQAGEAMEGEDAAALRQLTHPDNISIITGPDGPLVAGQSDYTQEMFQDTKIEKHQHTITAIKVLGPLAVTMARLDHVQDGRHSEKEGHLNFYAAPRKAGDSFSGSPATGATSCCRRNPENLGRTFRPP